MIFCNFAICKMQLFNRKSTVTQAYFIVSLHLINCIKFAIVKDTRTLSIV